MSTARKLVNLVGNNTSDETVILIASWIHRMFNQHLMCRFPERAIGLRARLKFGGTCKQTTADK